MTTYTQEMLFDKICLNYRVNGGTVEAAIVKTQKQLQAHAAEIWKDQGLEFLRWLEQRRRHQLQRRAFRNTEDGGHPATVVADQKHAAPSSEPDWEPLIPEVAEEIEHGDQSFRATKGQGGPVPVPVSKPGVPWVLRERWLLKTEVKFAPAVERRELGNTDQVWWTTVNQWQTRTGETMCMRGKMAGVIAGYFKNGKRLETFTEMVIRIEAEGDVLKKRGIQRFLEKRVTR